MPIKIFDCSNSAKRPGHRGGGGPFQNDVVGQLKKYASDYNCVFISDYTKADVLFTNDVYPDNVLTSDIPKIKRMDGIFYRPFDKYRNDIYNTAAVQSSHVIFISRHAQNSFNALYGYPISSTVVLNVADPAQFSKHINISAEPQLYLAACTNWNREEKRLSTLVSLAETTWFKGHIGLIGTAANIILPSNMTNMNYLSQNDMHTKFKDADAFLNFSYRDPLPKVVCQALSTGLPVLYANSGGSGEAVLNCGLGINDPEIVDFEEHSPKLEVAQEDWINFVRNLNNYKDRLAERSFEYEFNNMLKDYFSVFKLFA